jgi:O-glycosyl hydrolase
MPENDAPAVRWWLSTGPVGIRLAEQSPIPTATDEPVGPTAIEIDLADRYQSIIGFGASFTETACWLLQEQLDDEARRQLMREWLDPDAGIGINFVRQPMGATDIARDYYSYDDMPIGQDDMELEHFTLEPDEAHILPVLREAKNLRPDLTVLATPWSPPAWMRTDRSMRGSDGGTLREDAYPAYARYFAKFLEGYAAQGIPVDWVTVQNEPQAQPHYPGMIFSPADVARFVGGHLGPTLRERGLDTKILVHDHNWDGWQDAAEMLDDQNAREYIAGTAFHRYDGHADVGSTLHDRHPDKEIVFTEGSTDSTISLAFIMGEVIINSLRNWARGVILWNLLADQKNGPYMDPGGCAICRPVTSLDWTTNTWHHHDDYYALGHVAKFVKAGAVRVGSTQNGSYTLPNVALHNPDGSVVLVILNQSMTDQTFTTHVGPQSFTATLPSGSCATFVLPVEQAQLTK